MLESESSALPFGDSPLPQQMVVYTKAQNNAITFLKKFKKLFIRNEHEKFENKNQWK